jgi:hypothetical protein
VAEATAVSSLTASTWGFVYPDFVRSVTGFLPLDHRKGRGWATEQVWSRDRARSTMAGWATGVAEGWRPLQVFNATEVETGAAVRLAPLRLERGGAPGTVDPLCCDPKVETCPAGATHFGLTWSPAFHDMAVVTAARLSATFPYVTPVARAWPQGERPCGAHLADGGYFDNYGVNAAVELIDQALSGYAQTSPPHARPRIAIVQIESFPPSLPGDPVPGWKATTVGPLIALLGVRSASQANRNETELDLLVAKWRLEADIARFRFVLAPRDWPTKRSPADLETCTIAGLADQCGAEDPGDQPLRAQDLPVSWQLTCAEKRSIVCHWRRDAQIRQTVATLKTWYGSPPGPTP